MCDFPIDTLSDISDSDSEENVTKNDSFSIGFQKSDLQCEEINKISDKSPSTKTRTTNEHRRNNVKRNREK